MSSQNQKKTVLRHGEGSHGYELKPVPLYSDKNSQGVAVTCIFRELTTLGNMVYNYNSEFWFCGEVWYEAEDNGCM